MYKSLDRQKINLEGIQILRMLLSLWIVLIHCCKIRNKILKKLLQDKGFHVPIFLIISFYFFYDKLYLRSINKIKIRFERLLIPYMIYPIIIVILNYIFFFNNNIKLQYGQLFFDFLKQLIFGIGIHGIFWFQSFVIFLSVLFLIIAFIFKKHFLLILKLILIIYIIIPMKITGLIFASYNLINKINKIKEKKKIIFVCIIILYFIKKYDIIRSIKGFRFPGIALNVGSICLIICFSFITFKKTNKFLFIIMYISNYTGGIYYLHEIVKDNLKNKFSFIAKKTMLAGFAIYIICYFICFIGMMIFGKTKLKNLFY